MLVAKTFLSRRNKVKLLLTLLLMGIVLKWSMNSEADLAGYKLYSGDSTGVYSSVVTIDKATTSYTMDRPPIDTYFALTAFDTAGNESGKSEEVVFMPDNAPPAIPGKPTLKYIIEFE
jgi:hypothetical protein